MVVKWKEPPAPGCFKLLLGSTLKTLTQTPLHLVHVLQERLLVHCQNLPEPARVNQDTGRWHTGSDWEQMQMGVFLQKNMKYLKCCELSWIILGLENAGRKNRRNESKEKSRKKHFESKSAISPCFCSEPQLEICILQFSNMCNRRKGWRDSGLFGRNWIFPEFARMNWFQKFSWLFCRSS